jgi:chromosome segregation ATPase
MVRKRVSVSDVIQEEAQKFTPSADDTTIEVNAEAIVEQNTSPTAELTTQEPPSKIADATTTKRVNSTKIDLELTIKELQETLEKSHQQEVSLQKQIEDLQSDVSEKKSLAERLNKELDEAKKTVLQLADANSQLLVEINSLKQEKENLTAANSQLTQEINSLNQPKEIVKPKTDIRSSLSYRKSYHHTSTKLPPTPIDEPEDNSSQMWLLD